MIKHGFYNLKINFFFVLILLILSCKKKIENFEYDILNDLNRLNLEYLDKCCYASNFKNPIKIYLNSSILERVRMASLDFMSKNRQKIGDNVYLLEYLRDDNPKIISYLILNKKKIIKFEYDINLDVVEQYELKDKGIIKGITNNDWAEEMEVTNCCVKTIPHLTVIVYSKLNHKVNTLFVENTVLKMK